MNYKEAVKELDKLRRKDEVMFRMAINHLMDVGIRNLNDESVEETCADLMKQDDSHAFASNEFLCEIVRTAAEIAKIEHTFILVYISKNVKYDVS